MKIRFPDPPPPLFSPAGGQGGRQVPLAASPQCTAEEPYIRRAAVTA